MTTIEHLRAIPALLPLRGRHSAIVVCLDDPAPFERRREEIAALDAKLLVEREPGDLSARLGRPSVTVCDRYLEVALHAAGVPPDEAIKPLRALDLKPQREVLPQRRKVRVVARVAGRRRLLAQRPHTLGIGLKQSQLVRAARAPPARRAHPRVRGARPPQATA